MKAQIIATVFTSILAPTLFAQDPGDVLKVLDAKSHHLGNTEVKDWPETTNKPEARKLELKFEAEANDDELAIGIKQRDVGQPWTLQVNGKKIANLKRNKDPELVYYKIPAGALVSGVNTLTIATPTDDDIAVGPITLNLPVDEVPKVLQAVTVSVTDKGSGKFIPARITVLNSTNGPVTVRKNKDTGDIALRRGLFYTRGTPTSVDLPPGDYQFFATRGMEYGRAEKKVTVREGKALDVKLTIEHEVDTTGFVSVDTHLHTRTFSGHGDSTVEERMLTLAGEGLDMAVSTDHNHQTDYRPYQEKMQVTDYFTPVTGNEVTTPVGHMNAFPMDPKAKPPEHNLTNWVQLVDGIRAKGAKVVVLNHPRWPTLPKCPFTIFGLNRISGDFRADQKFVFDAIELANSLVPQPDPLYVVKDWFALLNAGHKITGAGASDTHTVGEPPGMSRSYAPSKTDDPTKVDVDDVCEHYKRGETSVSLGIFADVLVDGRYKMGNTNTVQGETVNVRLRVAAPSWVKPKRAILYLNGQIVEEKPVLARKPTEQVLHFTIKKPAHDSYVVCVVLGDGALHPSWKTKENFTLAATNPVFLDTDGDGQYSNPRALAIATLRRAGNSPEDQWKAMSAASDVVAVQMLSVMRDQASQGDLAALEKRIREAAVNRSYFRDYIDNPLPPIKISANQLK